MEVRDDLWYSYELECKRCFMRQIGVAPTCCERVECPKCGFMNQLPPSLFPGEDQKSADALFATD